MATPTFVDIHVHPDLKSFLSSNDEIDRKDCWQNLRLPPLGQAIDDLILGNILEPQSSLQQLNHSNGTIAMAGLYAFERAMVKGDLFNLILIHVNLVTIAKILDFFGFRDLLDLELMKRVAKLRIRCFNVFSEAHSHLLLSDLIPPGFNLLKKISDYKADKLNIILTVEGGHNLFKKICGCLVKRKVIANIKILKTGRYRFLFLGPAHLARNRLCTHAYGIKFLYHRQFMPVGYGITRLGRKAIKYILTDPRILIDIKHMSLVSRKQFYAMLKAEYATENIPIIASHVGMTGVSWDKMPIDTCRRHCRWSKVLYHQPAGHITGTKFNPWSINLYDEDILEIINSNGLIGLSLDARILGARQDEPEELIEYFSRKEFICGVQGRPPVTQINYNAHAMRLTQDEKELRDFEKDLKSRLIKYLRTIIKKPRRYKESEEIRSKIEEDYTRLLEKRKMLNNQTLLAESDLRYLCNNILHIVKVGGESAWKHICIGSDFDGLVNAIECCRNATEYGDLAQKLKQLLTDLMRSGAISMRIININQKVDDIMAGNARDFLERNFI